MEGCRVYWGSHGCNLARGHEGPHRCSCADDDDMDCDPLTRIILRGDGEGCLSVGAFPYYGPETNFYGEDVRENEMKILITPRDWIR